MDETRKTIRSILADLTEAQTHRVWHITDIDSARDIMAEGFKAVSDRGDRHGVSVSVNPTAAAALLNTLQRMNSFEDHDAVVQWWIERGVDPSTAEMIQKNYIANLERKPERTHPGHLYLDFNQTEHPAVGGPADVPHNEFLWNDIARKLVGKDIVAVEAYYTGDVSADRTSPESEAIEAEEFVQNVDNLNPVEVIGSM